MSKLKPNIITPFNDRERFKNLVQEVINDTTIFTHVPDSISLSGVLFTLTLSNKKSVYEEIKVDDLSDYVDVYLQGINFTENITLAPELIVNTDFSVKGKIVSR